MSKPARHLSSHPASPGPGAHRQSGVLGSLASVGCFPHQPPHQQAQTPFHCSPQNLSPTKTTLTHTELSGKEQSKYLSWTHSKPPLVLPCSLSATFTHICLTGERMGQRMGGPVSLGLACWWQQRFGRQGEPEKMVPYLGPRSGGCLVSTCCCRAEWPGLPHTIALSGDSRDPHVGVSRPASQRPRP